MSVHKPYRGSRRRLVIAFDVGTTYSGISYSILEPGRVPEIKGVTKFPGQEDVEASSKIPTTIYYDFVGKVAAAGAETESPETAMLAEENCWFKCEWFKLHLKFTSTSGFTDSSGDTRDLPQLPLGKTARGVLADFYRYLLQCLKTHIEETHPFGDTLWQSLAGTADYVLSHPNGWGGKQQTIMRKAAIDAGLVPDTKDGQARVSMVTEGEASLHFALDHGLPDEALDPGNGVVIVDAGGGTIDISTYARVAGKQYAFEEIATPQSHLKGAIYVTVALKVFMRSFLKGSKYLPFLDDIAHFFDKKTKLCFSKAKADAAHWIKFGTRDDHEPRFNIRFGQVKVEGKDAAKCFDKPVRCIIETVKAQKRESSRPFNNVVLVGGMSANDYLFNRVKKTLINLGFHVYRPDYPVNKAVSNGAISHYLNHYVQARVAKVTYGVKLGIEYNPNDPEHRRRSHLVYSSPDGVQRINVFSTIISKGTKVEESSLYTEHTTVSVALESCYSSHAKIISYNGAVATRFLWLDVNPGLFEDLCTITIDIRRLLDTSAMEYHYRPDGYRYGRFNNTVVMQFGHVELKAFTSWVEDGTERSSDAQIVYFD